MDRIDSYLSRLAHRAWSGFAQVVEMDDGSWRLFIAPGSVGRVLAEGGPRDPLNPRARFHVARAALKRLVSEQQKISLDATDKVG